MDTQTQIDRLIELAIVQRSELKQLVSELPQLREYLGAEIERTFEEAEPQIRTELEEFCRARATDEHAKTGAALAAKVEELSKQLEVTTAAKYSVLMAERAENVNLLAKAEARIEDAASMLSHAVKEIVTDELSRFPRAGEIDQLRKEFAEPRGLNPRGRWMPDETYQRLDLVTINGDSFVSNIDGNRERPSRTAGDWTLSAARGNGGGGGGVTTMTDLVPVPTDGQLLIGNGSAFVNATLTAGTGISISNGPGSITINATDGNITLDDGTAAAPSLNFTNEPTTGLFRASANVMGFAVNGTSRATMTTTGVTVTGTITPSGSVHAAAGSVGNPSLAFSADQDTGLFNIGANNIGVAVGGAKVLDIATTGMTVTGALGATSLTAPASTALTLTGGSSGASLVLGQGTTAGAFTLTPTGTGSLTVNLSGSGSLANSTWNSGGAAVVGFDYKRTTATANLGGGLVSINAYNGATRAAILEFNGDGATDSGRFDWWVKPTGGGLTQVMTLKSTGNLLIGTTTDMTGSGGLKVAGTTAASSATTGALQVAGGVGVAGAVIAGGTNNGANEYSYPFLSSATTIGGFATYSSGATVNQRIWAIQHGSASGDGVWRLRALNDALSNGSNAISITRTAEAIGTISLGTTTAIVSVLGTTAGSSGAGALVVAGGLATGAASYIGGALTAKNLAAVTTDYTTIPVSGTSGTGSTATHVGTFLSPSQSTNAGAGTGPFISVGVANSTNNTGVFQMLYAGAGSTSNAVQIGLYGNANVLKLDGAGLLTAPGAATFAGAVAIGNTVAAGVAVASTHKVTMVIGGVTYYLLASNV